jgi:ataxin 2/2L
MPTDTEISKPDSREHHDKELVPWEGDSVECDGIYELDDTGVSTNGWDAEAMFIYNEKNYNLKTTYDESLKDYT